MCSDGADVTREVRPPGWLEQALLVARKDLAIEVATGEIVSTSGFCQVAGPSWGPRSAVLYLSEVGGAERVEVSIDCAVRPPTP